MTLKELEQNTLQWSHDRGITVNGKSTTQALKLVSEVGELCDNLIKGKDVKDDLGDIQVVLTNIAKLEGTTLEECWTHAWNDIKDRKGFLNAQGNFIKSTDAHYKQALMEFNKEPIIQEIYVSAVPEAFVDQYRITCLLSDNNSRELLFEPYDDNAEVRQQYYGKTVQQYIDILSTSGKVVK